MIWKQLGRVKHVCSSIRATQRTEEGREAGTGGPGWKKCWEKQVSKG